MKPASYLDYPYESSDPNKVFIHLVHRVFEDTDKHTDRVFVTYGDQRLFTAENAKDKIILYSENLSDDVAEYCNSNNFSVPNLVEVFEETLLQTADLFGKTAIEIYGLGIGPPESDRELTEILDHVVKNAAGKLSVLTPVS